MKPTVDRTFYGVALALVCLTLIVYWPALQADFINYDDQEYVVNNAQVKAGLTWAGVQWAFTTDLMGSWHPITWLSHMLDVQLFGLDAPRHHAVNLVLHTANVLLLFVLFVRLAGAFWPSAIAAALFAVHPLHVESVAWIAERKDVLSVFFGLLGLVTYARYVASQSSASQVPFFKSTPYWLTVLCCLLGLMSKPMLVTFPLLLLLLDVWPLRRVPGVAGLFQFRATRSLWLEKIPFFLLVGLVGVITLFTQHRSEAVMSLDQFSLASRLANVLHSFFVYLWQFVWPVHLAPFYPFEHSLGAARLSLAALVVLGVVTAAWALRRRHPYVSFGVLWYFVALLPVCGLVQAGLQAHADRYMYLPSVGLGVALVWLGATLLPRDEQWRKLVAALCLVVFCCLGWLTYRQTELWQNSERLFRHTLAVTEKNFMAHQGLGEELLKRGELAAAKEQFLTALDLYPQLPSARNNLGVLLMNERRERDAIMEFDRVLKEQPKLYTAYFNRAEAHERLGQFAAALADFRQFVAFQSEDLTAHLRIVNCLNRLGQPQEAARELQQLQQAFPAEPRVHAAAAAQFQVNGDVPAAIAAYERGLTAIPDSVELNNNLAWLLATQANPQFRNGARAVALAERANRVSGNRQPFLLGTLAAAYAEAGRFPDAITTAERAIELATAAGQPEIAARNRELLELYRSGRPYHEPAPML